MAISTVRKGRDEARAGARPEDVVNVRRSNGKRPYEAANPKVWPAIEKLVDPVTRGDPESSPRWTCKSTHMLSAELFTQHGIRACDKTVAKLLRDHGYSLQAPNKSVEGAQHPDRNAQFEHINAKADHFVKRGLPVISVDTKKKELVGNFKNGGREWQPQGEPELVDVHDFPSDAIGKAIPYGVYDLAANDGFVSVGVDHDTPVFAVTSIEAWYRQVGEKRYPDARELFITADAGGSNGHRPRVWKAELQRLDPNCRTCTCTGRVRVVRRVGHVHSRERSVVAILEGRGLIGGCGAVHEHGLFRPASQAVLFGQVIRVRHRAAGDVERAQVRD